LASDTSILPRLLIVGALDRIGSATGGSGAGTATIASGSNRAGSDTTLQSRFLVEAGIPSYNSGGLVMDGNVIGVSPANPSLAAARVGAYVSLVRQKYPNLTAANTADILLATARYDTLSCYPNCDKSVYGQGEASLSRALAPVGYLR